MTMTHRLGAVQGALAVSHGISAAQGLMGTIQGAEQGNALAALSSGLGGIGGAVHYGAPLGHAFLGASAAAGSVIAIQGGNPAQALAALTTAAGEAGLTQPLTNWIDQAIIGNSLNSNEAQILKALTDGASQGTGAAPYVWGSQIAQADEGVASDEPLYDGQPITLEQQVRITQFHDLQQQLAQIDPANPYTSSLSMPGWVPDQASIDQVQGQINAVLAAQGQAIQAPIDSFTPYASSPTGMSGFPVEIQPGTNSPEVINGYKFTGHALDRMQGRGIPPSAIINAINNGFESPGNAVNTKIYSDPVNNLSVVLGNQGQVITVRNGAP